MNIPFVDLKAQYGEISGEIDAVIKNVIDDAAFVGGKYVKAFEKEFARFCGVNHCVGVANGTDALFITLKALGIGAGDEVITVANSFVATSEAVTASGARVVFVDCHPRRYTIDVKRIEEKITSRTRAIIPVHLYGQPADMGAISEISEKHGLRVIEDAAQAHGALCQGKKAGSFGDAACFSFYPGKNLGAYGDGGAIVTKDRRIADMCRMLANHGRVEKYNHEFEGFNSRLDGMQAGILSVKLKKLAEWNAARRQAAEFYTRELDGLEEVHTPCEPDGVECVYHLYVIRTGRRDELLRFLKKNDIGAGIHYPIGLPFLKAYEHLGHRSDDFPVTRKYQDQIVSLPIYPELTPEEQRYVAEKVREFILSNRAG